MSQSSTVGPRREIPRILPWCVCGKDIPPPLLSWTQSGPSELASPAPLPARVRSGSRARDACRICSFSHEDSRQTSGLEMTEGRPSGPVVSFFCSSGIRLSLSTSEAPPVSRPGPREWSPLSGNRAATVCRRTLLGVRRATKAVT